MKHIDIARLEAGGRIESVYLLRDVEKKFKKTGEPFVMLNLQDATGVVKSVMWNDADIFLNDEARSGDFVLVKASVGRYNNQLQLTIREARKVDSSVVDVEKFLPRSERPLAEMRREIIQWVNKVKTPYLRALLEGFFGDDKYMTAFLRAPSARKMHQAYLGGLAEHTLGVVKNAIAIARNYDHVDEDLLITGALLHDGSKVYEYTYQTAINYTDRGRLLGHLSMMAMEIENRVRKIEGFPEETKMLLEHMILSHHGKGEFGSPKVPQTAEALILFYADYVDAYLSTYFEQTKKAHEKGERWTEWVDMFNNFLYAGEPPAKKDKTDDANSSGTKL